MRTWPYPAIVAHRGGGKLAPENTLEAIDVGARFGHKMIEFDAKLSADDIVFLLHDDAVDRTSNGRGAAKAMTYAQLHTLDAGTWFSAEFADARMPTLAQVYERCAKHGLAANIEIKPSQGRDVETGVLVGAFVGGCRNGAAVVIVFIRGTRSRTRCRAEPAARHAVRARSGELASADFGAIVRIAARESSRAR
jgi:hypothetical protein